MRALLKKMADAIERNRDALVWIAVAIGIVTIIALLAR